MSKVKPITNEAERKAALDRLDEVFHSDPETPEGREVRELAKAIQDYEKTYCSAWTTPQDASDEMERLLEQGIAELPDLLEIFGGRKPFLELMLRERPMDAATIEAILARYNTRREWLDVPFCRPPGWASLTDGEWLRTELDAMEGDEPAPGPEVAQEAEREVVVAAGG